MMDICAQCFECPLVEMSIIVQTAFSCPILSRIQNTNVNVHLFQEQKKNQTTTKKAEVVGQVGGY